MKVEIYSKPECSLCDVAKATILRVQARAPFTFVEINIEERPDLNQRYRYDIPLVFIDGQKAFKHRVDEQAFERRIRRGT